MNRLHAYLSGLTGWRRHAAAGACGLLATLAMPPLHLVPALVPAFAGWLWLIVAAPDGRRAFLVGWAFGFAHFVSGLYWIGISFFVDAARFGWAMPFAVGGLSALMGLFPAVAGLAARYGKSGWLGRVLALAIAWTVAEWVRGWFLTGFPWNLMGTVWTFSAAMIQPAAWVGVLGLGLATVGLAALPAVLIENRPRHRRALWVGLAILAAWGTAGAIRLATADAGTVADVRLRLVQPNIPQKEKWQSVLGPKHVRRQLELSVQPPASGQKPPNVVIWSETAVPYLLTSEPQLMGILGEKVPPDGYLITGAPRRTPEGENLRIFNSVVALDGTARVAGLFDKFHLVPFGEYVPLRAILNVAKLTVGDTDFSPGPGPASLHLPGLPPFSPLVCYEVIFTGEVVDRADRPAWLLNLTNDGWFGLSSGPYQHFAAARLRAVEEGLPLVRVANTGISAVIDAHGRITARLGLGEAGALDADLPNSMASAPIYARFSYLGLMITLVLLGGGLWILRED